MLEDEDCYVVEMEKGANTGVLNKGLIHAAAWCEPFVSLTIAAVVRSTIMYQYDHVAVCSSGHQVATTLGCAGVTSVSFTLTRVLPCLVNAIHPASEDV